MLNTNQKISKKGAALVISIIILTTLLAISLGLSTILIGQMKMFKGMEDSVQAFFAADTGIEKVLFVVKNQEPNEVGWPISGYLNNNEAKYEVQYLDKGENSCSGSYYCLKSKGVFRERQRAIEIAR